MCAEKERVESMLDTCPCLTLLQSPRLPTFKARYRDLAQSNFVVLVR
jgi:hypothetical protein